MKNQIKSFALLSLALMMLTSCRMTASGATEIAGPTAICRFESIAWSINDTAQTTAQVKKHNRRWCSAGCAITEKQKAACAVALKGA
jgi:hypothetical protein